MNFLIIESKITLISGWFKQKMVASETFRPGLILFVNSSNADQWALRSGQYIEIKKRGYPD